MLLTSTNVLEGYEIRRYLGLVAAETIISANVFRDVFAEVINFFGGRARGYEKEMQKARNDVLDKIVLRAQEIGATGIVGLKIDYEFLPVGKRGGMLMVMATGTAVTGHPVSRNEAKESSSGADFSHFTIGGPHG